MNSKIIFGVLNWGLGHASRSIPIIHELLEKGNEVIIASDSGALILLQKEFPNLKFYTLTPYNVNYKYMSIVINMISQALKINNAIKKEAKELKKIIDIEKPDLIISDNRFGFSHKNIKTIFITHQLNIQHKNPLIKKLANIINHHFIQKFDELWIPDFEGEKSIAGELSDCSMNIKHKYIGIQSNLKYHELPKKYDICFILSGPEPSRTKFEKIAIDLSIKSDKRILIIQGKMDKNEEIYLQNNVILKSHTSGKELNDIINQSELIICRSGYSSVMDMVKLNKKAIFVPTPGQTEQEYLGEYLSKKGLYKSISQQNFKFS
ncbi:MAG: glycosyltransferase family protein [Saprospiraceae bacterium]